MRARPFSLETSGSFGYDHGWTLGNWEIPDQQLRLFRNRKRELESRFGHFEGRSFANEHQCRMIRRGLRNVVAEPTENG